MNRNQTPKGNRPVHHISRGRAEAAIWERDGKKGRFFQVSFSRPYKTQEGGFGSSENFGSAQLPEVAALAMEALVWMEAQRKPRVRNGHDEQRAPASDPDEAEEGDRYEDTF